MKILIENFIAHQQTPGKKSPAWDLILISYDFEELPTIFPKERKRNFRHSSTFASAAVHPCRITVLALQSPRHSMCHWRKTIWNIESIGGYIDAAEPMQAKR